MGRAAALGVTGAMENTVMCGNLAAAVAHATRNEPNAAIGKDLIYPGLGGDMEKGCYITHSRAPMLTVADIEFYQQLRTGEEDVSGDASFAQLWDTDFSGLPPNHIFSAQCDLIADDGARYRDGLKAAGVNAVFELDQGSVHGHLRARHMVKRARDSFSRKIAAINKHIDGVTLSYVIYGSFSLILHCY